MNKFYLFLLLNSYLYSQTITFPNALDYALKNNKDLKNQKLEIEKSYLDGKIVDSISYGKATISEEISNTNHAGYVFGSKLASRSATFDDFGAKDFMEGMPNPYNIAPKNLNYPDSRDNFATKLSYDLPLFTGFKLSNQKDILALQKKAYEIKYKLDEKNLAFEVLKAYNGAVTAKEFIKAVKKAKESILAIVKASQSFHKEGLITKIDVKQAMVYELNINSKMIEAQNQFDLAIAYLKFLTSNSEISDVENLYFQTNTDSSSIEEALKNRDEVQMQNIQIKALKKNVEISKADYYPTIYSHTEYGFNDETFNLSKDNDYYLAMIGLSYTLFDNTRTYQKEKSKIELSKAITDFEKLNDGIKLEFEKATLELKAKEKVLKEKTLAKDLAQDILEQSKLMYKNQLISMTNLLEQEANLRKNEADLILAQYEKTLAHAKLYQVLGKNFYEQK